MSGYRAGSDFVGSLRRLRDRFHDIEPGEDRPLGARRLKESALSPTMNILALGLVVLAGVLCLAKPIRVRPSPVRRVRSRLTRGAGMYRDVFDLKQPGILCHLAILSP
jgi:hypothetical protein